MQLSHLTIYCMCVLSNICRRSCVQEVTGLSNRNDIGTCIVARVCILTNIGTVAHCVEEAFISKNASMISFHLVPRQCMPGQQELSSVGWFIDQPFQQWIGNCWNKKHCSIQVKSNASHVGVSVLMRTEQLQTAVAHPTCVIRLRTPTDRGHIITSQQGVKDVGCLDKTSQRFSINSNNGINTVDWIVPTIFYKKFNQHISRQRKKRRQQNDSLRPDRKKRNLFGDEILNEPYSNGFPGSKRDLKDLIFSDSDDSSDIFTGELTPDEQIWDADLPESGGSVMTFPDDYMNRIPTQKHKKKLKQKPVKPKDRQKSGGMLTLFPQKVFPEFKVNGTDALKGKDMMMALEESIENRLYSSLSNLMEDNTNREDEEMSVLSSLSLEDKVDNALSSVQEEPSLELKRQGEPEFGQYPAIPDSVPVGSKPTGRGSQESHPLKQSNRLPIPPERHSKQLQNKKANAQEQVSVSDVTLAKTLPPPDETISNVNKPRLPQHPVVHNASSNAHGFTTHSASAAHNATSDKQNLTAHTPPVPHDSSSELQNCTAQHASIPGNTSSSTQNCTAHSSSMPHNSSSDSQSTAQSIQIPHHVSSNAQNFKVQSPSAAAQSISGANSTKATHRILTLYPQQPLSNQPPPSNAIGVEYAINPSTGDSTLGNSVLPQHQAQSKLQNLSADIDITELMSESKALTGIQLLEENIQTAESTFNLKFQGLMMEVGQMLHVKYYPKRKKVLQALAPSIKKSTHALAWAMIKQVCEEPMQRMVLVNAGWQDWSVWSACTTSCGSTGYRIRRRFCTPEHVCSGSNFDLKPCHNQPICQASASWLGWSPWGPCSASCKKGGACVRFRARSCLTDDPDMRCKGQSAEVMGCSSQSCKSACHQNATSTGEVQTANKTGSGKTTHSHKNLTSTSSSVFTSTASTITTTTTAAAPKSRPKRREKQPPWKGKRLHEKNKRWPHDSDFAEITSLKDVDEAVDDLQGEGDTKRISKMAELVPFQPLYPHTAVPAQDLEKGSVQVTEWSVWGLWSLCVVTCGKGVQFRKRECMKRMGDTVEGEAVNPSDCTGNYRERKYCAEGPCPLSVVLRKQLMQAEEGGDSMLKCNSNFRQDANTLYWIAPNGERIMNSTEKYTLSSDTLTIHKVQQSDLGEYVCIVLGDKQQQFGPKEDRQQQRLFSEDKSVATKSLNQVHHISTCRENPCENGGTCKPGLEMNDLQPFSYGEFAFYRCECAAGFYGKHCEQKSLVHLYTPNLRIMGIILMSLISVLCLTCTVICIYYCVQRRMQKEEMRPIMTRRRSEDQWHKMKSFDQKGHPTKKSFSPKQIKKRLSRMWTGKQKEEPERIVKFGIESSPYSELVTSLASTDKAMTEITQDEFEKESANRPIWNLEQPSSLETEVKNLLDDSSQNASPPPVAGGMCGHVDCTECTNMYPVSQHSHQTSPAIIYSDDQMEIFASKDLKHLKHIERESSSLIQGSLEDSPSSSKTYIFKSRLGRNKYDFDVMASSPRNRQKSGQKQHSKEISGLNICAEYELNQNNSDESNEGNSEQGNETYDNVVDDTVNRPGCGSNNTHHTAPTASEKGHQSASQFSSTDSGDESENNKQSYSGTGARPKVRCGSKQRNKSSSRKSRRHSEVQGCSWFVSDGMNTHDNLHRNGSHVRSAFSRNFLRSENQTTPSCKAYEIKHPDEPYPYRSARTRRRPRDMLEETVPSRAGFELWDRASQESSIRIPQSSIAMNRDQSPVLDLQWQPSSDTSQQRLKYLEGGGEGAAAAVRNESRKSGREVLLRRAMENSYIQATTGRDLQRLQSTNAEHSAAADSNQSLVGCDLRSAFTKTEHTLSDSGQSTLPLNCGPSASITTETSRKDPSQSDVRQQEFIDTGERFDLELQSASSEPGSLAQLYLDCSSDSNSSPSPSFKGRRSRSILGFLNQKSSNNASKKCRTIKDSSHTTANENDAVNYGSDHARRYQEMSGISGRLLPGQHRSEREMLTSDMSRKDHNAFTSFDSRLFSDNPDTAIASNERKRNSSLHETYRHDQNTNPISPLTGSRDGGHASASPSFSDDYCSADSCDMSAQNAQETKSTADGVVQKRPRENRTAAYILTKSSLDSSSLRTEMSAPKSAMKQYSSLPRLSSVKGKQWPLRRVSFSEPKVHRYNELKSENRDFSSRRESMPSTDKLCNSTVLQGDLVTDTQFDDISHRPCGPLDLDAFSAALPNTAGIGYSHAEGSAKGKFRARDVITSTNHRDQSRQCMFLQSEEQKVSCIQGNREVEHTEEESTGKTTYKQSKPSLALTMRQSNKRAASEQMGQTLQFSLSHKTINDKARSSQTPLLVDLEPENSGDLGMTMAEEPVSRRLLRLGLLSPLSPSPAVNNVQTSGCNPTPQPSQHCLEGSSGQKEAGKNDPAACSASQQNSSLSLESFQELVAMRVPGAFFKPIDKKDSSDGGKG